MTKHNQSTLERKAKVRRRKAGTKTGTLLTGKVEPIPDDNPRLKSIDDRLDLFHTTTIESCCAVLKKILPYWSRHQQVYAYEAKLILLDIRWWLVMLRRRDGRKIPPIPSDFLGIWDWITTVEKVLQDYTIYIDEAIKKVVWDETNLDYIPLKEATDSSGGLFDEHNYGKRLRKKDNTVRWMNSGQRTRVCKSDFDELVKTQKEIAESRERISGKLGDFLAKQP